MAIKVLIVEDNNALRDALKSLLALSDDFICLGEYERCMDEIIFAPADMPDVVLMDIDMPGENGISCTKRLKEAYPFVNVLMLTVIESEDKIIEAICAGATGYLLKSAPPANILESIRMVHNGGALLTPSVARKIFITLQQARSEKNEKVLLNKRESEILSGLVSGLSYKMIAEKYFISVDTVRSYIRSMYEKLEVHSRSEAIVKALKNRLV